VEGAREIKVNNRMVRFMIGIPRSPSRLADDFLLLGSVDVEGHQGEEGLYDRDLVLNAIDSVRAGFIQIHWVIRIDDPEQEVVVPLLNRGLRSGIFFAEVVCMPVAATRESADDEQDR